MASTIGVTDYDSHHEPFLVCDWCDDFYDGRYCEKCGPVLSGDQIADLMLFVEEMDGFDLNSDVFVANLSSLMRELYGEWYDESEAYQKMCYEYLERQARTSQIDKVLNFFGGSHDECTNCGMMHDVGSIHVCR